ncbi:Uncharacterised protein [Mycobacterium tuberculosis]|nr:Uncharacterised protein [Mycobacterium tuberculosis]
MLAGFFEFFGGLGQDLGEHRVFGIEVEVETGAGYPCAKADSAHRQFRERCLLQQFACGPQNRLAMPVTTPSHRRRSLLLVCGMTGHLLITPLTLHHGV